MKIPNLQVLSQSKNIWNPFIPTEKDKVRTQELANKNPAIAGVLTLFFCPAGLIYLNRGINSLKIVGYTIAILLLFSIGAKTDKDSEDLSNLVAFLGVVTLTSEQVITVKKARLRLQGKSAGERNMFNIDDKYSKLKELNNKRENNEITEEEFKVEKQKIIDSV